VAIKEGFRECIRGSDLKILDKEPMVRDYFDTKFNAIQTPKRGDISANSHTVNRRMDFVVVRDSPALVVDNTIVCPSAK
jgi:hypothetical protein